MEGKSKFKLLLKLFTTFLKIGAFTFGGGYAMIPLIQTETSEKQGWITEEDILEIVAIAESTPGPIAINAATFVGYKVCGFLGSFFATFGVVLPSFVIIFVIAHILKQFESLTVVRYAFFGIRAGVLALVLKALVNMFKKSKKNIAAYIIMSLAFLIVIFTDINVLAVIIGSGLVGLSLSLICGRRDK